KQRETRRGRAELRLVDLTSLWSALPNRRSLPSLFERLTIRLNTDRRRWSEQQRRMMGEAARLHPLAIGDPCVFLATVTIVPYVTYKQYRADEVLRQFEARPEAVNIRRMEGLRFWIDPILKQELESSRKTRDLASEIKYTCALFPSDRRHGKLL